MRSAKQLILNAMERDGITWPDVQDRIVRDEAVSVPTAASMIERAQGKGLPLEVAAAIITLISDKKRTLQ